MYKDRFKYYISIFILYLLLINLKIYFVFDKFNYNINHFIILLILFSLCLLYVLFILFNPISLIVTYFICKNFKDKYKLLSYFYLSSSILFLFIIRLFKFGLDSFLLIMTTFIFLLIINILSPFMYLNYFYIIKNKSLKIFDEKFFKKLIISVILTIFITPLNIFLLL